MALRKPSERRHRAEEVLQELNLIPIMNLICLLIPVLLLQMAMIQIAVINVSSPQIGSGGAPKVKKKKEKPPLNLTITISDKGFYISGSGGTIGAEKKEEGAAEVDPDKQNPTIAKKADGKYDYEALTKKLDEIKNEFPEETRVILMAEPDTNFEILIQVMDATRQNEEDRILFPDVVLSAGLA